MRKEIVVAIIAGVAVGLIIAFGIWRANRAIVQNPTFQNPIAKNQNVPNFGLTLVAPSNRQLVTESTVKYSGATSPNAIVVIITEDENYILRADNEGAFEQEVELVGGLNQTTVFAFSDTFQVTSVNVNLVYSSQFAESSTDEEVEASDSAEILRQKVQEKIEEVASSPIFYIGTITDKQEGTLQISNLALSGETETSGSISQITVSDETEFVAANGSAIDFTDVAIGDFIIAMGLVTNGDEVLSAQRIILSETPSASTKNVIAGTISEITTKKATVTGAATTLDIVFGKTWEGPEISEFEVNEEVVTITEVVSNQNTVLVIEKLTDL